MLQISPQHGRLLMPSRVARRVCTLMCVFVKFSVHDSAHLDLVQQLVSLHQIILHLKVLLVCNSWFLRFALSHQSENERLRLRLPVLVSNIHGGIRILCAEGPIVVPCPACFTPALLPVEDRNRGRMCAYSPVVRVCFVRTVMPFSGCRTHTSRSCGRMCFYRSFLTSEMLHSGRRVSSSSD